MNYKLKNNENIKESQLHEELSKVVNELFYFSYNPEEIILMFPNIEECTHLDIETDTKVSEYYKTEECTMHTMNEDEEITSFIETNPFDWYSVLLIINNVYENHKPKVVKESMLEDMYVDIECRLTKLEMGGLI